MNTTEKRARELSQAVAALSKGYTPKPQPVKPRLKPFHLNYEAMKVKDGAPGKAGDPGTPGTPGKDAIVDMEAITKEVIDRIRKEKSLLVSDLKDGQSFIFNKTKYATHEMMHGGSSSNTGATTVIGEVVSGSGTAWTLAHSPTSGTLAIYGIGQRLTSGAGNDFTQTGTSVTTVNSFSAGQILADYSYL